MKAVTTAMLAVTLLAPLPVCGQENPPPSVSLHLAALQGNIDAMRQHIRAGSDLNERDAYGSSPLIVAAAFGKTEVARALIEAGADLNLTNNDGGTALHTAAFFCRTEIVRALRVNEVGRYFRDLGYGYQWWSASAGDHDFDFAWGHGGQLIVLLDDLDMIVVATADPFYRQHDDASWRHERAAINLVGKFIESLPKE